MSQCQLIHQLQVRFQVGYIYLVVFKKSHLEHSWKLGALIFFLERLFFREVLGSQKKARVYSAPPVLPMHGPSSCHVSHRQSVLQLTNLRQRDHHTPLFTLASLSALNFILLTLLSCYLGGSVMGLVWASEDNLTRRSLFSPTLRTELGSPGFVASTFIYPHSSGSIFSCGTSVYQYIDTQCCQWPVSSLCLA